MSNEQQITRRQETPATRVEAFLTKPAVMKRLATFAKNNVKPETMIRLAVVAVSQDEWLAKCSPESVYLSLIAAAQIGLEPSGIRGEAYLVPFKGKCTLIPGWRGLIKLALRSKAVRSIYSHLVYEGDDFTVTLGTDVRIHHKPLLSSDPDRELIAAYAVAVLENGAVDVEFMDRIELERIKAFAMSGRGGKEGPAYEKWTDQMFRKAPIRRLCKRLPLGDDYFLAAKLNDLADEGSQSDRMGDFIEIPAEAVEEKASDDHAPASRIQQAADRAAK